MIPISSTILLVAISVLLIAPSSAHSSNPDKYLKAQIYRNGRANDPSSGYYWIDLGFGSFTASCIVDSGSGDLWVADRPGGYQADQSSYQQINSSFSVKYDSNVGASGNWGTESITLPGGLVADNVLFGDATSPGKGSGFMGVSLKAGGALPRKPLNPPQILIGLVANNVTNSMTYSLYPLLYRSRPPQLPIRKSFLAELTLPYIPISDISFDGNSLFDGYEPYPILVDSGTIQILLPKAQADAIAALVNATYHPGTQLSQNYFIAQRDDIPFGSHLVFTFFGKLEIHVPWRAIVNSKTEVEGQCIIPIGYAQHKGGGILGAEFLRYTYLVFDADNGRLAMSKAAIDHGTENTLLEFQDEQQGEIITIPAGTGLMPNAEWVDPLPVSMDG